MLPDLPRPAGITPDMPQLLAGWQVLVVDDIATNRLVAMGYLSLLGARCREASGGAEALAMLAQEPAGMILLDMYMPGMDGAETLARIRALPAPQGAATVIAVTADAGEEHRRRCLALGVEGYLAKPLSMARLRAELACVLPVT